MAKSKRITRIEIGSVSRPHGIQGEVKIQLLAEFVGSLDTTAIARVYLDDAETPTGVRGCREHQGALLLRLDNVLTRNDAEAMRGVRVSLSDDDLPDLEDGEYYAHDLIGLEVRDDAGVVLGELVDVLATGSNDVYVVARDGGELLLPAIESCIKSIDFDDGIITVVVPDGL
jgi:16S rRNA processing protein RimM